MSYLDDYNAAFVDKNDDTYKRTMIAILTAGKKVMDETPITANHSARATYARLVLADPAAHVARFLYAVGNQASDLNDLALQTSVDNAWNTFAL